MALDFGAGSERGEQVAFIPDKGSKRSQATGLGQLRGPSGFVTLAAATGPPIASSLPAAQANALNLC